MVKKKVTRMKGYSNQTIVWEHKVWKLSSKWWFDDSAIEYKQI